MLLAARLEFRTCSFEEDFQGEEHFHDAIFLITDDGFLLRKELRRIHLGGADLDPLL